MKSLAALLVVVLIWGVGLMAFADRAARANPPFDAPTADGIVVLTGASDKRIETGMELLEQERGRRLLVSGVNRQVTRAELRAVTSVPARLYDCCVDLGYDAEDTLGNAQEIAAWARAKNFRRLIVVTSDYHMPRSLLEIEGAMPESELQPYPVQTPSLDARRWWRTGTGARRMVVEYTKYLGVLARETVLGLGRKREPAAPAQEEALSA
ncbi:MAG TPA: YdcF family protein [Caulobacteraceae bacterium]|nr:YdcF family protein [Caulobacteraceae bacterium]